MLQALFDPPDSKRDVLTMRDACELLQRTENTVRRLIRDEGLPAFKIGREWRFLRTDVIAWCEARQGGGVN